MFRLRCTTWEIYDTFSARFNTYLSQENITDYPGNNRLLLIVLQCMHMYTCASDFEIYNLYNRRRHAHATKSDKTL